MSWRAVRVLVLGVALASFAALGAGSWRDKVAPSVLRWIDSGTGLERDLLVQLAHVGAGAPSLSYAGASHTTWLGVGRPAALEIQLWSTCLASLALRRADASPWEAGLPYVHALGSIMVRASVDGARQLAQLGSVATIFDAAASVPAPAVFASGEATGAQTLPAPGSFLGHDPIPADELEAWMASLGWRYITSEELVLSNDPAAPLALSTTPLEVTVDQDVVGVAVADDTRRWLESIGVPLATALDGATWASATAYAPTVAELARLVEAMGQTGADGVGIASIAVRGQTVGFYVLLRSVGGSGWASPGLPGPGTSTTRDALPRGEAPSDVLATLGSYSDRVVVQWRPAPGASTYEILRTLPGSGTYEPIGMAIGALFEDANVESCVRYAYVARSIDVAGLGMESAEAVGYVGQVPMPPADIWTDNSAGPQTVRVEWTPSEGATGYRVMRTHYMTGSTTIVAQQYAVGTTSESSFLDRDIIVGQTYLYRVFALNGCGQSRLSPQAKGSAFYVEPPAPGTLAAPSWFETTRGTPRGQVVLTWTAADGADSYLVYRALAYTGPFVEVARVTANTWTDLDVVLCGDAWYRVASARGATVSAPSPILYGSFGYRPVAPERVRASRGTYSNSIRVDWAAVEDALSYNVLRAPAKEGPYAVIASSIVDLYFVDEGLSPGQTFWYQAQAANPCGCSGSSVAVFGSTSAP